MTDAAFKYVFGPVLSRRLGRSLGVDVVPFKTCTYNCIYCQLGETTNHTLDIRSYVPLENVLDEIRRKLEAGVAADYITIAGSGEPTLYAELGRLIAGIKGMTSIPVAVLTNGGLLWKREVQDALLAADVVIPSLDAGNADSFAEVNRPRAEITFEKMVEGLVAFRRRYTGQLWLEVFLLHGVTDSEAAIAELARSVERICPDRVQLNTVARPAPGAAGKPCLPVSREDMEQIGSRLGFNAEVIAHYETTRHAATASGQPEDLWAMIQRHPCSIEDFTVGLGLSEDDARRHIQRLLEQGAIHAEVHNGVTFYLPQTNEHDG